MKKFVYLLFFFIFVFGAGPVYSEESTSASFKMLDPVLAPSGYSTSTGFQLWGAISEVAIGTSTSASFGVNAGFLYFPFASSPVVSATAGSGQVALSWTASTGYLGWTASGYNIAQSTTSSGPYSYTNDVTSPATRTGLTNGTTYYFVVVVRDIFGNAIASSTEVSATPAAGTGGTGGTGGSGGSSGSGSSSYSNTGAIFLGRTYPKTTVTLLKDAQVAATTVAGADANFQIALSGLTGGSYIFSVYSEDKNGNRSSLLTFPVSITSGVTTKIGGIFLAPTIAVDKSEVKRGDNIAIFGQSAPAANIVIAVNSEEEIFVKAASDAAGIYLYNFDTVQLQMGDHSAKSKAALKEEISSFSRTADFKVGVKNVLAQVQKCSKKGDLNDDCRVNLVDFSIAAFWYKKTPSAAFGLKEKERLNGDKKVDLVDFSIMAYYWTG